MIGTFNETGFITLSGGRKAFIKKTALDNQPSLKAEADGLMLLAGTGTIRVPEIYDSGKDEEEGCAYLILQYLEGREKKRDYWEHFGRQLAAMHRADTEGLAGDGIYGLDRDNYIGAGRQINTPKDSWIEFFRDCRLLPQIEDAEAYFDSAAKRSFSWLLDHLDRYLVEPEYPSLLHGDLWGGNFVTGPDGYAWLIDPAVYLGHREADLAMTELFGGFSAGFYDSYRQAAEIPAEYDDRRDLYNLYHLLNHLNLFGGGYYGSVMQILRRYAG